MDIQEHPIYKDIYGLCLAIEDLPASEHQTKCSVMACDLQTTAKQLVNEVKRLREAVHWVASRKDFTFAESSIAEEIVEKCQAALNVK